ncbi:hypothetical protein ACHAQC_003633 [Fusarium culmorum]
MKLLFIITITIITIMASPKPNDTEMVDASKLTDAPPKPTTSIKNALNAFMAKSIPVYKSIDAVLRVSDGGCRHKRRI